MRVHFQFLKRFQSFGFFLGIALLFGFYFLAGEAQSDSGPITENAAPQAAAAPAPATAPAANNSGAAANNGAAAPSGASGAVTEQQADEDYAACKNDRNDAVNACTQQQSTAGMNQQQAAQMAQLQQQAQGANAATSQMTQDQAAQAASMCKLQADLSAALGAMSAMKGNACSKMVSSCNDDCNQAASDFQALQDAQPSNTKVTAWQGDQKRAKKLGAACGGLSSNAGDMAQAAGSLLGGLLQNLMCAEMYATASPTPTNIGTCADPTFAATSVLCVCQNDPKNAMCTGTQAFPTGLTSTAGDLGTTSPPTGTLTSGSLGQVAIQATGTPTAETGSATTDGGGGAGLQAARGNPPNPSGDAPPPGSNIEKGVITGTMGGGGGGGGGSPGGSSALAANARGGGGKGGFDLSKFLPKSPTRGPAGMTIPAKDGITGPMGPTIWQKISNQYQLQKANMIPEQQGGGL